MLQSFLFILVGLGSGIIVNILADIIPFKVKKIHFMVCNQCGNSMIFKDYFCLSECRVCHHRKRTRILIVLIIYLIIFSFLGKDPLVHRSLLENIFTLIYFGVVTIIDIEYHAILYSEILIGVGLGIILGMLQHGWWQTFLGGAIGFIVMLGLYYLGILVQKYRNRKSESGSYETEALGFGDVNLMGVLGLFLGFPGVLLGLFMGILLAGIFSLGSILWMVIQKNYRPDYAIPYGPFLVLGTFLLIYILKP